MSINLATVFSGIGAPEQALEKLKIKTKIIFACDNGEIEIKETADEIKEAVKNMSPSQTNEYVKNIYKTTGKKNYVKQSYVANYSIKEDDWYDDIRFLDGTPYKNKVDIIVGGSPCQSFSIIGKRAGLEDTRGTLFFDYARLIKQVQPKVFIYENVPGMLTHDKGKRGKLLVQFLILGYKVYSSTLNARIMEFPR